MQYARNREDRGMRGMSEKRNLGEAILAALGAVSTFWFAFLGKHQGTCNGGKEAVRIGADLP
jgi:hypothetical protein